MEDLFIAIITAPIGTILIVAGILFLLVAAAGRIKSIDPGKAGRIASGVIGIILFGVGFAVFLGAIGPSTTSEVMLSTLPNTHETEATQIESPPSTPTVPPQIQKINNFSACPESCTGFNATRIFPEATTKLYLQWDYEYIPINASYIRVWTMNGKEWVRYQCAWPGPSSGTDRLSMREPEGFHSGTWEITITIDGVILLREQIEVEGNWTYWDPAGPQSGCYGQ